MQTLQVILTTGEAVGLSFTAILIVVSIITLILKIRADSKKELDTKVNADTFKAHCEQNIIDIARIKAHQDKIMEEMNGSLRIMAVNYTEMKTDLKWIKQKIED